ncbi:MAG: hypothetical protein EGQ00_05385 [Parabacteroides johnsonii]|nr:hypothetical protein [Parabacteroides johnsonii]
MKKLKSIQYVKIVTVLGLLAILSLQMIWLYNMYDSLWNEMVEKAESQLWASIELETIYRFENIPDSVRPKEIVGGPLEQNGDLARHDIVLHEALLT